MSKTPPVGDKAIYERPPFAERGHYKRGSDGQTACTHSSLGLSGAFVATCYFQGVCLFRVYTSILCTLLPMAELGLALKGSGLRVGKV
jgi:hypothetical protein